MKNFLLLSVLVVLTGCATPNKERVNNIAPSIKTTAFIGTTYALREHPEWRKGFEIAVAELKVIEAADAINFQLVLQIVSKLPVKELKSKDADLIITSATIMLDQYNAPAYTLEQYKDLKPIVKALYEGIELALK